MFCPEFEPVVVLPSAMRYSAPVPPFFTNVSLMFVVDEIVSVLTIVESTLSEITFTNSPFLNLLAGLPTSYVSVTVGTMSESTLSQSVDPE